MSRKAASRYGESSGEMHDVDPQKLTPSWSKDEVEVYWMRSPLMIEDAGGFLGKLGLWHSGVGFKNNRTGLESCLSFYAKSFSVNLLLPKLTKNSHEMPIDNGAKLVTSEGKLDFNYWTEVTMVAKITGRHYNKYIRWAQSYVREVPEYHLFNLAPWNEILKYNHQPAQPAAKDFPPGSVICFDINSVVMNAIKAIAGTGAFVRNSVKRNDLFLWAMPGTKPRRLDIKTSSVDYLVASRFFSAVEKEVDRLEATDGPAALAKEMYLIATEANISYGVYIDGVGDFWSYIPAAPYAKASYREVPIF